MEQKTKYYLIIEQGANDNGDYISKKLFNDIDTAKDNYQTRLKTIKDIAPKHWIKEEDTNYYLTYEEGYYYQEHYSISMEEITKTD